MSSRFDADVLIVGDGPGALALAALLRRALVPVHVVDGRAVGAPEDDVLDVPTPLRPETLDVLADLDVLEDVRAISSPVEAAHISDRGGRQIRFDVGAVEELEPGAKGLVARTRGLLELLEIRLEELGGAVERGAVVERIEPLGGAVFALVEDAAGRRASRKYRWVVDTIGRLRDASGVPFAVQESAELSAFGLVGHVPPNTVTMHLGPGLSLGMVLPAPPGELPRLVLRAPAREGLRAQLDALGAGHLAPATAPTSLRTVEGVAARYREGRLLLLGRAAASHSLPDLHGANLGLADAASLAWRLARVVQLTSLPQLLDGYEAERRPIATALLEMRARHRRLLAAPEGARFSRRDVVLRALEHAFVRERLARRWLPWKRLLQGPDGSLTPLPRASLRTLRGDAEIALAAVTSGAHLTLLCLGEDEVALPRSAELVRRILGNDVGVVALREGDDGEARWADWTLVDPGGALRRALDLRGPGVALVRPDRCVAFRGPADPARLEQRLRATLLLPEPLRALRVAL